MTQRHELALGTCPLSPVTYASLAKKRWMEYRAAAQASHPPTASCLPPHLPAPPHTSFILHLSYTTCPSHVASVPFNLRRDLRAGKSVFTTRARH